MLLSAENITKSYATKILLDHVSLYLNEGDKIGIVGVNGTGKSTFLKILAGLEQADEGTVVLGSGKKIGYLPQDPDFTKSQTVLEQIFSGVSPTVRMAKEYEAKSILTQLGITDFDADVTTLSGGQKKRIAIAGAFVTLCDILILDEPTNHIDNDMVDWLEKYLQKFRGAIIMVTHDRYFLNRVSNSIIELDHGALYRYEDANYSVFLEKKAERMEMAAASERKRQSLMRKELAWLSRGARARGTKSRFRIERYEEMSEQATTQETEKLAINSISSRLGKKTIQLNQVSKAYGDNSLIRNFSYLVPKTDRLGIIGKNGCGKSTLLKLFQEIIQPDSGFVEIGTTVKFGYFSQESEELDLNMRVIDSIKEIGEYIQTVDGSLSASQMLEKFLFSGDLQWNTIGRLSGGERRRLSLLRVLMGAPNVLLLDEPTNDLDIETLTILEEYLDGFDGAVITVSHDRYFLDKVTDHLLEFRGNGEIKEYLGGYSDYFEQASAENLKTTRSDAEKEKKGKVSLLPPKLKFTFKEQKEFDEIDAVIADLEQKIERCDREMQQCSDDYVRLQQIGDEKQLLEHKLDETMERWVYLNELAQKIEEQGAKKQ